MPSVDDSVFGRLAVLNGFLRQDQLDDGLKLQQSESYRRPVGEILVEKGHLTEAQLRLILEIRRKRGRRLPRPQEGMRESDRSFGNLALDAGLITLDDLEDGLLEQQRLGSMNLHFRLGEIFVSRKKMKVADVLEILRRQGKRLLLCPACDACYNVVNFQTHKSYRCSKCGADLLEPKFLDSVAADATIDG